MATAPNAVPRTIVLVGMRGSGKTTLGRELAARLGRRFVDVDELIEGLAGRTADAVLAQDGEPAFRALEARALGLAAEQPGGVVASGGGSVLLGEAFARLRRGALVAFLDAPPEVLERRASVRPRPALTGLSPRAEIEALRARRLPLYREAADVVIPVGLPGAPDPILAVLSALQEDARP
jgi:shikimate kinase